MTNTTLGGLIKMVRQQRGWTLRQTSDVVGIPLSTLAKVETDKLSLTYDKLQQFTSRLGMTMTEFLGQDDANSGKDSAGAAVVTGRRSLTSPANSISISTPNYHYEYLCADLKEKRMVPILTRIRAHDIHNFGDKVRHQGEEFIYVLEGEIEVHLQFYTPIVLKAGEGIYLDSMMGHAYVAHDCETALVLAVCSSEDVDLADELIHMAASEAQ